jgi:CheY-like chemotaxis protein
LDVVSVLRTTGDSFSAGLKASDLSLDYEWKLGAESSGEDPVYHIEADRELLCNALDEVLENAYTYAEKPARISITAAIEDRYLDIHVRDHGIGLENEGGMALVKPFTRGKRCYDFQPFGFGLGLANAKAFMETQGGDLYFTQEADGTDVVLRLPLPEYDQGQPYPADVHTRKIAICLEDAQELQLVQGALESEGHQVSVFETADGLLDSAGELHPELIIMDGMLRGKSTEGAVRKLAEPPLEVPAPVIVLAADADPAKKQAYIDCGAHSYVPRPLVYSRLTALVQQLL